LGAAFHYIFMGGAIFFIFLGFQNYRSASPPNSRWQDA